MRVFLTGANGFLGGALLDALLSSGHDVVAPVRGGDLPTRVERIHVDDLFKHPSSSLRVSLAGVDSVIHAAWASQSRDVLHDLGNWNSMSGSILLGSLAREAEVRHFIGIGTCLEYDTSFGYLTPETPLNPSSTYGLAKVATFQGLSSLFESSNSVFSWVRPFFLYGRGDKQYKLASQLYDAARDGSSVVIQNPSLIRDFLPVEEAASQIVSLLTNPLSASGSGGPETNTRVYNVCSGVPRTVRQFAQELSQNLGGVKLEYGDELPSRVGKGNLSPLIVGQPSALLS